jgi:hypothetical protein
MMNVSCRVTAHEEGIVVYILLATINVGEESNISLLPILAIHVQPVRGNKIEVVQIELPHLFKVLGAQTLTSRMCFDASIPYSFLHSSWLW